jgi:hypothetical protein
MVGKKLYFHTSKREYRELSWLDSAKAQSAVSLFSEEKKVVSGEDDTNWTFSPQATNLK